MPRISDNLQYPRVIKAYHCGSQSLAHMPNKRIRDHAWNDTELTTYKHASLKNRL